MRVLPLAWFKQIPIIALALAIFALAACEDDTTNPMPGQVGDPALAAAVLDSVIQSFFDDNEAVGSVGGVLGGFITQVTGSQPSIAPLSIGPAEGWRGLRFSAALAESRRALTLATGPAAVPDNLLGVTCIWDLAQNAYVGDPQPPRAAPPLGISFRLYTLNPATGLPAGPTLSDIGFVDIVDLADNPDVVTPPDSIDVTMVSDVQGATVLDYAVRGNLSLAGFNLNMAGYVADDAGSQVPFDFTVTGDATSTSTSTDVTVGSIVLGLDFDFSETAGFDYVVTVNDGTNTYGFTLGIDLLGMVKSGSVVTFNGSTIATITGNEEIITITPSGTTLTTQQIAALNTLFGSAQGFFLKMALLFAFGVNNTGNSVIIT